VSDLIERERQSKRREVLYQKTAGCDKEDYNIFKITNFTSIVVEQTAMSIQIFYWVHFALVSRY
jgi:hypothetical protein